MPSWLIAILSKTASTKDHSIWGMRSNHVCYYRECKKDFSIIDFTKCSGWQMIWPVFFKPLDGEVLEFNDTKLIRNTNIRNVMQKKDRDQLTRKIIRCFSVRENEVIVIPCESHLVAISPAGICVKRGDFGARGYSETFNLLRQTHYDQERFLNHETRFLWNDKIDSNRFEELIHDLMINQPNVLRVIRVGHCNEPDGGRDLIADVLKQFLYRENVQNEDNPNEGVRIIIQCKAFMRNITKSDICDIRDMLEMNHAAGVLLVLYPGMSRALVDYVENIRQSKKFLIECWTKTDLELRLRENIGIAKRFPDLLSIIHTKDVP
jgi:hypothetical protein